MALGCAGRQQQTGPEVRDLQLDGARQVSAGDIRSRIMTTKTGWWPFATPSIFDPYTWQVDLRRIVRYYHARGFYQARVLGSLVKLVAPGMVDLVAKIDEGTATRIRQVRLDGVAPLSAVEREELVHALPLRVGDVFEEARWNRAQADSRSWLRDHGHALAEVEGLALVDVKTQEADLTLVLTPGPRFRFGVVKVRWAGGDNRVPAEWIVEQAREGLGDDEWYSDHALARAQRFVTRMRVFSSVRVSAGIPDTEALRVPVIVDVLEAPTHEVRLGGGIAVDQVRNEVRLVAEYTDRNFMGGLRRLTLSTRFGWVFIPSFWAVVTDNKSQAPKQGPFFVTTAEFEQPRIFEHPSLRLRSTLIAQRQLEQAYDFIGGRLTTGVVWQPHPDVSVYPSYSLEAERLNAQKTVAPTNAPLTIGCPTNPCFLWLSYLDETVTLDRRDNILEPRAGYYLSLGLQQGGGPLGGDFTYFRLMPEARGYTSFGRDKEYTLAGRIRMGALVPESGGPDASPISTRFFAGGADSMRGFNHRRLSPLLIANVPVEGGVVFTSLPIGGNGLIESSIEMRFNIVGAIVLAAFLDTGMVSRDYTGASLRDLNYAVGLGLRYLSPIGPIRLDFARRLNIGSPPPAFNEDGSPHPYTVNTSCFGLGGTTGSPEVPDGSCVLHLSIGEAF